MTDTSPLADILDRRFVEWWKEHSSLGPKEKRTGWTAFLSERGRRTSTEQTLLVDPFSMRVYHGFATHYISMPEDLAMKIMALGHLP